VGYHRKDPAHPVSALDAFPRLGDTGIRTQNQRLAQLGAPNSVVRLHAGALPDVQGALPYRGPSK
jgi:hypothetical protein